jgi:hypothetical protein
MTASRDPDRMIHAFLEEGAEHLADQGYDAVRVEVDRKRQRVVIGQWRMPTVNELVPIALGAAALVVVVIVGAQLIRPAASGNVGAGGTTPTAAPSPSPSVAASSPSPAAGLPEGSFALSGNALTPGRSSMVTISAPGWEGEPGSGILVKDGNADAPDGAGMIGPWIEPLYVYGDPCKWSTTTPKTPASAVGTVVAALRVQASRNASAPVDVTLDGHPGKKVTLHVPQDAVFDQCDQGKFASWAIEGESPSRWHQDPGQTDEVWVVDLAGTVAVIDAAYYAGTPAKDVAEMRAIVESITFK